MKRIPISNWVMLTLWAAWLLVVVTWPWKVDAGLVTHLLWVVGLLYCIAAQARMSRWPALVCIAANLVNIGVWIAYEPNWLGHLSVVGIILEAAPLILAAVLILPHWRKLSWNPLGVHPSQRVAQTAEVF